MNKIEEKVSIIIEDDKPKDKKGQSQDIIIEMNTGDGISTFETIRFNGRLEALILTSNNKVALKIKSELGYNLLEATDYIGTTYNALRTQAWDETNHQLNFQSEPFYLNEKLVISIQGQPNTNVKFIFRMIDE